MTYRNLIKKYLSLGALNRRFDRLERQIDLVESRISESLFHTNILKNSRAILLHEDVVLTTLFTGQKIYANSRDSSISPHIILDGIWEPEITNVFRSYLHEGSVVLDIGANIGYFGIISGASRPEQIHFFEPNPKLVPLIRKSLSVNGLMSISVVNPVGVGGKETRLSLNLIGDYLGSSSFVADTPNSEEKSSIIVPVTTVDSYSKEHNLKKIDIVKIDVEGFEPEVYTGMKNTIKNNSKLILFIEFSPDLYKKPDLFFKQIRNDFKYIYYIDTDNEGQVVEVKSYSQLRKIMSYSWAMIIAQNNKKTLEPK